MEKEPFGRTPVEIGSFEDGLPPTDAGAWPGRIMTEPVSSTLPFGAI
jgi:hypothetical protein